MYSLDGLKAGSSTTYVLVYRGPEASGSWDGVEHCSSGIMGIYIAICKISKLHMYA